MVKKLTTTFDKWMADPKIKEHFDKDYKNFVLSELILALMENDGKSVRELAKEVGLSPTVIQNIKSGKQQNMKIKNVDTRLTLVLRREMKLRSRRARRMKRVPT